MFTVRNGYLYTIQIPLKPSGHYMYRRFNIQQFYVLPTQLYLCVLCESENKQRLFPYTTLTDWFLFITETECLLRGTDWICSYSGHYMYHQFNIQQLYVLPHTLYLCVLCGSQNKQPLFPYTTLTAWVL